MYRPTIYQIYATDDPMWITSHQAFQQLTKADPFYLDYRQTLDPLWNGLIAQASEAIESADYDALSQVLEHLLRCVLLYGCMNTLAHRTVPCVLAWGIQREMWALDDAIELTETVSSWQQRCFHYLALLDLDPPQTQRILIEERILRDVVPFDDFEDARSVWGSLCVLLTGERLESHQDTVNIYLEHQRRYSKQIVQFAELDGFDLDPVLLDGLNPDHLTSNEANILLTEIQQSDNIISRAVIIGKLFQHIKPSQQQIVLEDLLKQIEALSDKRDCYEAYSYILNYMMDDLQREQIIQEIFDHTLTEYPKKTRILEHILPLLSQVQLEIIFRSAMNEPPNDKGFYQVLVKQLDGEKRHRVVDRIIDNVFESGNLDLYFRLHQICPLLDRDQFERVREFFRKLDCETSVARLIKTAAPALSDSYEWLWQSFKRDARFSSEEYFTMAEQFANNHNRQRAVIERIYQQKWSQYRTKSPEIVPDSNLELRLNIVQGINDTGERCYQLLGLLPHLNDPQKTEALNYILHVISQPIDNKLLIYLYRHLLPYLQSGKLGELISSLKEHALRSKKPNFSVISQILPYLDAIEREKLIDEVYPALLKEMYGGFYQEANTLLEAFVLQLDKSRIETLHEFARQRENKVERARLLRYLTIADQQYATEALEAAISCQQGYARPVQLQVLTSLLSGNLKHRAVDAAIHSVALMQKHWDQADEWKWLIPYLEGDQIAEVASLVMKLETSKRLGLMVALAKRDNVLWGQTYSALLGEITAWRNLGVKDILNNLSSLVSQRLPIFNPNSIEEIIRNSIEITELWDWT